MTCKKPQDLDIKELPELNKETLEYINQKILSHNYVEIIELCLSLVFKNLHNKEKDALYELMEKITLMCDKSNLVAKKVIRRINLLLKTADSWIQTECLIIMEKISKYWPEILITEINSVKQTLQSEDYNIREISLNIIGNLILNLNLHENEFGLFYSLVTMMKDKFWKLRVRSVRIGEVIFKSGRIKEITTSLLNKFIEMAADLMSDKNEEVQDNAVIVLKEIASFINPQMFQRTIVGLLADGNQQICENCIWLIGEVGINNISLIIPILPKLIDFLGEKIYTIQVKATDAFVKIGRKYPEEVCEIIFISINNLNENTDIFENLSDILIYIGKIHINSVFRLIIKNLEATNRVTKEFISKILRKLNNEVSEKIEEQIALLFQKLDSDFWRIRYNTVRFLGSINFILKSNKLAAWTYLKLNKLLECEKDPEVIDEIKESIKKIKNFTRNIEGIIEGINREQNLFYRELIEIQNLPKKVREKMLQMLKENKINKVEIVLEKDINTYIKKSEIFGKKLYNYTYRRLDTDLLEDWNFSRSDLLEQFGNVKSYIKEKLEEKKERYLEELQDKISGIKTRIDILIPELDVMMELNTEIKKFIINGEKSKAKEKMEHLTNIRDKIFRIESEIMHLWIEYNDFNEQLKDVTIYWAEVKIEVQQLLYTVSYNLRELYRYLIQGDAVSSTAIQGEIKDNISFELLFNDFRNLILQSTRSIKEQFESFEIITSPVADEIEKSNFDKAQEMLDLIKSQTINTLEDFNKEILKNYSQMDDILKSDIEKSRLIRDYFNDWSQIKDLLTEKTENYYYQSYKEILVHRCIAMQKIINPIPLKLFAAKLKTSEDILLEQIISLIEDNKITGRIKGKKLYFPEYILEYAPELEKMISLSKKIEIIGNSINLSILFQNTTRFFLHDFTMLISWPVILEIEMERSAPKWIEIKDIPPEETETRRWVFKKRINKTDKIRNVLQSGEIKIFIKFKDIFNNPRELDLSFNIIL
ncbi:MAG: hypothetical protein ACTSWY_08940 [Promethearchaeota archaeon]